MSYILEALKKSDQQRQRGVTPTLPTAQTTVVAPKKSFFVYYGLLAAVLLCAGIAIGWLHPWQAEQPAHATDAIPVAPATPVSNPVAPIPLSAPPEMPRKMEQKLSSQNSIAVVQAAPGMDVPQSGISAPATTATISAAVSMPRKPGSSADAAQEQKVVRMAELPVTIQQEIPVMTIQLHSYSSKPMNSLVSINSRLLKEGEFLTPWLKLEQITPDGVIFSYKGYRFQHGIW